MLHGRMTDEDSNTETAEQMINSNREWIWYYSILPEYAMDR